MSGGQALGVNRVEKATASRFIKNMTNGGCLVKICI